MFLQPSAPTRDSCLNGLPPSSGVHGLPRLDFPGLAKLCSPSSGTFRVRDLSQIVQTSSLSKSSQVKSSQSNVWRDSSRVFTDSVIENCKRCMQEKKKHVYFQYKLICIP